MRRSRAETSHPGRAACGISRASIGRERDEVVAANIADGFCACFTPIPPAGPDAFGTCQQGERTLSVGPAIDFRQGLGLFEKPEGARSPGGLPGMFFPSSDAGRVARSGRWSSQGKPVDLLFAEFCGEALKQGVDGLVCR